MQKLVGSGYPGVFRKLRALSPAAGDERPVGEVKSHRLKALRGRRGATGMTSPSNSSDAALTGFWGFPERNLRVSAAKNPPPLLCPKLITKRGSGSSLCQEHRVSAACKS